MPELDGQYRIVVAEHPAADDVGIAVIELAGSHARPGRAVALARRGLKSGGKQKVMIFVNNRYEGHSPGTIRAVVDQLEQEM
ncbi:MAG: hypothetical protein HC814_01405 [Rhodobacteraceae bacterium]|nr:hypothetical protein [Paracoccaceae bacterium]